MPNTLGRKMTAKDAIVAGALGAVIIAIRFIFMIVGGLNPYAWFSTHFLDAVLIGPIFMLLVAKTRKTGPMLIINVVNGLVLIAATWMLPVTMLIGGILCELCLRKGKFENRFWLGLGFLFFNLGFISDFLPLWLTKESYLIYAADMGIDPNYLSVLQNLTTAPVFCVIVVSVIVGTLLGSLLGFRLMRKHFSKAGLAK